MLDIRRIRENPDELRTALKNRGQEPAVVGEILRFDEEWRALRMSVDEKRAEKNKVTHEIAQLKKEKKGADAQIAEMQGLNLELKSLEDKCAGWEAKLREIMLNIPNMPHESVPVGAGEEDNPVVRKWGEPAKFGFKPKEHWELAPALGMMDFERGVKLAGHRFTLLTGDGAKLERALMNLFLDTHAKSGYTEVFPPLLVNEKAALGTGNLPKFADQLYHCPADGLYLIPTSEVPLANIYMEEIVQRSMLPMRFCAYTPCFRREAGEYQRDIKGYLRQHQFNKVELVHICEPKDSYAELEMLTKEAELVLQLLKLPYTITELCTGDMGFASAKTYDINVWLPGQGKYREIASCSNCEDFQARRGNTRYYGEDGKPQFPHTLNGSGVAVGRALIAIIENFQQEDGSVLVPEALRPYMGGKERIG